MPAGDGVLLLGKGCSRWGRGAHAGEGVLTQGEGAPVRLMFCPGSFLYYAQVRPVFCFPASAAIYSPRSVCHSACDPCGQLKAYI